MLPCLFRTHCGGLRRACLPLALLLLILFVSPRTRDAVRADAADRAATKATLAYSSFLGGNNDDSVTDIAVDSQGNIYVLGDTYSTDLLGQSVAISGNSDLYVAKFNPTGNVLLYLTLFGGPSDSQYPGAIEVDGQGNAYVSVYNLGDDIPLKNPLWDEYSDSSQNGALFKLNGSGKLIYSTLIPLNMFPDVPNNDKSFAIDPAGNVYFTGTGYQDFDYRRQIELLKINASATDLQIAEYFGGPGDETGLAIYVDDAGYIYVAGITEYSDSFPVTANAHQPECGDITSGNQSTCVMDGVVVVFNPEGDIIYSSYHGGGRFDYPFSIDADGTGNILVAGDTNSADFPLAHALQTSCPIDGSGDCYQPRAFVSMIKLNAAKSGLTYSTYLGSTEKESSNSVRQAVLDAAGRATVIGYTNGLAFPTAGAIQPQRAPGLCGQSGPLRQCNDAFIATFSPTGALAFGTYLGGASDDYPQGVAVGGNGVIYLAGLTNSNNFPVTANALQPYSLLKGNGFLSRIDLGGSPPPPHGPHIFLPAVLRK